MEKSFQTLNQDPWNKLKVYVCWRLIESEASPKLRAQRFLELAELRRAMDPAFAFDLVEAALKTAPGEAAILARIRKLLEAWDLSGTGRSPRLGPTPSPVASQMPKGVSGETAARPLRHPKAVDPAPAVNAPVKATAEPENSQATAVPSLAAQKRALKEAAQSQIKTLGVSEYFRRIAKSRGVPDSALSGLEDFQSTWMAVVQFLELLRVRKGVTEQQWAEIRDEVEAVLMLIEARGKALKRVRELETN